MSDISRHTKYLITRVPSTSFLSSKTTQELSLQVKCLLPKIKWITWKCCLPRSQPQVSPRGSSAMAEEFATAIMQGRGIKRLPLQNILLTTNNHVKIL